MGVLLRSSSNDTEPSRVWTALLEQHSPSYPIFHNLSRFIDANSPTAPTQGCLYKQPRGNSRCQSAVNNKYLKYKNYINPFSATRHYKRHQHKVKVKGLDRNSSHLAGFSIFFFFFMVLWKRSIYLSLSLSIYLFICLSIYLSLFLSLSRSHSKEKGIFLQSFFFFLST